MKMVRRSSGTRASHDPPASTTLSATTAPDGVFTTAGSVALQGQHRRGLVDSHAGLHDQPAQALRQQRRLHAAGVQDQRPASAQGDPHIAWASSLLRTRKRSSRPSVPGHGRSLLHGRPPAPATPPS